MASIKIFNDRKLLLDFVVTKDNVYSKITGSRAITKIKNISFSARRFKETNGFNSSLIDNQRRVVITEELPFRVRFTNKKFINYGPNNPPPIGVAVIGYNNYIL